MRLYKAFRNGDNRTILCLEDGKSREVLPGPSQKIWNHSPDGFNWGYLGSGPAQTALAILLDYTKDRELSAKLYQTFKFDIISQFDKDGFELPGSVIDEWLGRHAGSQDV